MCSYKLYTIKLNQINGFIALNITFTLSACKIVSQN